MISDFRKNELTTAQLRRLDLTLLLVFLGLIRRRKAADVADEMGLTQSAISQALKRLRDVFGDDLFLRRPHGMEPTAVALALEGPVTEAVETLRGALGLARAFDPLRAEGVVRVAALDAEQASLIPPFAARLCHHAPGLRVSVLSLGRAQAIDALVAGSADLALGFFWDVPEAILQTPLFDEGFLVAGRPDVLGADPDGRPMIDLDTYCARPHVLVSPAGDLRGIVDDRLEAMGRARRVMLGLPAFLPALAAAAASGGLVTLPARLARAFAPGFGLVTAEPPLAIRRFTISAARTPIHAAAGYARKSRRLCCRRKRPVRDGAAVPPPGRSVSQGGGVRPRASSRCRKTLQCCSSQYPGSVDTKGETDCAGFALKPPVGLGHGCRHHSRYAKRRRRL